ncbi:MAG: hypothetical protein AAF907_14620 [Planctomycetota bacterium]
MKFERLREVQKASPFHPYALHMADGRRLQVRHPEFVILNPDGRTVVLVNEETGETHILDGLYIADVVTNPLNDPKMSPEAAAG